MADQPPYLAPSVSPAPLEGQALQRFLAGWFAGVSGLAGNLVRPRWQPEPANIPGEAVSWCAVGIMNRRAQTYPWNAYDGDAEAYQFQNHEDLEILSSWYGLGIDSQADYYAARMRDGSIIPQNRDVLMQNGFGLVSAGECLSVPSLMKTRWLYRVDLPFVLRREIVRVYQVDTLASASGTIETATFNVSFAVDEDS
jgi:hypothetical protein